MKLSNQVLYDFYISIIGGMASGLILGMLFIFVQDGNLNRWTATVALLIFLIFCMTVLIVIRLFIPEPTP
jgi:hypothetical protein